jgi:hypothetical protein
LSYIGEHRHQAVQAGSLTDHQRGPDGPRDPSR